MKCSREFARKMHYAIFLMSVLWCMLSRTWCAIHKYNWLNGDITLSGTEHHIMATIQTKIKFNVRKKRLISSKLNNGKENANYGNKISSATSVCVGHGRKFYENKCQSQHGAILLRPCLLSGDSSDSDSDIECLVIKQHENKKGVKKAPCTRSLHAENTEYKTAGLCIPVYFIFLGFITFIF